MRGDDRQPDAMFSYVSPRSASRRTIRCGRFARWSTTCCATCRASSTACMRASAGPSIPPERLLRAQLLQMFYSIRSERLLMEQLRLQHAVPLVRRAWRWTSRSGRRRCSPRTGTAAESGDRAQFFRRVVERAAGLMSDEHFTVDGTLIEAWASQKSFQRKDGGARRRRPRFPRPDRGRTTRTRRRPIPTRGCIASRTAPSRGWRISGIVLMENRHGLIADAHGDARRWLRRTRGGDC